MAKKVQEPATVPPPTEEAVITPSNPPQGAPVAAVPPAVPQVTVTVEKGAKEIAAESGIQAPERVEVKDAQKWNVIHMLTTLDPAPRIGIFDCNRQFSGKMLKDKRYKVPEDVADILVEQKACVVVPGA